MLKRISLVVAMVAAMVLIGAGCISSRKECGPKKCCGTCKTTEVKASCCGTCQTPAKACAADCKKPCCAEKADGGGADDSCDME